jgi:aspartate/methionine/tyrosine aminotransferase
VAQFQVMRVLAAADTRRASGRPVFDFSVGQPSTAAPAAVRQAASQALAHERLGYTGALGLWPLRVAIAAHYRRSYGIEVDPDAVAVTTGSSGGLQLAFLAAFDPGDTVLVTRPGYPAVRNMLLALGCEVLDLELGADFALSVELLQDLQSHGIRPAGLVLASPANPTGTMITDQQLAAIVAWCEAGGVQFISDEIYHGISYGAPAQTAWHSGRSAIVLSSFSKYFSMTGWRIGWLLLPEALRGAVDRLAGNFTICPPTLSQFAALAAFDSYAELDANVTRYRANRDLMLSRLPELGLNRLAPADGAFYVYADVSDRTTDSLAWSARLLDEAGVAVAPGIDFDHLEGGRFVRFSFAGDSTEIRDGLDALASWLGTG